MTRGDDVCEIDARDVDAEATWVTFDAETSRDEERSNFLSERMTDDDDATAARFDARDGGFDGNGDALDVTRSVRGDSELERVRERLASAEANALRATEALDAERAGRERERRRFTALLRAKGVDDARDASSEDAGEGDGGGWGTRVVSALASEEATVERDALERFVRRARSGEGAREDGGIRMTLADAEAVLEDLKTRDVVLARAKEEATTREALLAKFQAEAESSTRKLRDHDEAHALLTAEIGDLRDALAKTRAESNALAEETTALSEALESAKAEALEWKRAADVLKRMQGGEATAGDARSGDKMLVLELECALEALTTTRAELEDVNARLAATTRRADLAEKREAVAAAALEASESRAKRAAVRGTSTGNTMNREAKERLDRAEVRVAQLQRRLDQIDGEHVAEMQTLQKEHERICLHLKMNRLSQGDATELMRLEIEDVKRESTARAVKERDAYWRGVLEDVERAREAAVAELKRKMEGELVSKNTQLQRFRHDLVQMLKETA